MEIKTQSHTKIFSIIFKAIEFGWGATMAIWLSKCQIIMKQDLQDFGSTKMVRSGEASEMRVGLLTLTYQKGTKSEFYLENTTPMNT